MFKSTFVVGSVTVPLGVLINQHNDKAGALRELECNVHFGSETDWLNFRSLVNWSLEVVPMPWGNIVEVLVKGGPGSGTLTIPGFGISPFIYTAWLEEATSDWTNTITSNRTGRARFLFTTQ